MRGAKTAVLVLSAAALGASGGMAAGLTRAREAGHRCELMSTHARDELAAVESRVEQLQADLDRSRVAALQASLEVDPDVALRREAERLGVFAAIARSGTGLGLRQQERLAAAIVREARRQRLDPLLVTAVITIESSFDAYAVSPVGAMGLMQLMPDTGRWLVQRRNESLASRRYLFDYERNVELGCAYLAELIRQFGSVETALLAYNVGPTAARQMLGAKQRSPYPDRVLAEWAHLRGRAGPETASR
jgi:soluble lytic murein transglycosylase